MEMLEAVMSKDMLTSNDLALLRRFEPILCFTLGEQFVPMDADRYLADASLSLQRPGEPPEPVVPRGQLDASQLGQIPDDAADTVRFLSVATPLTAKQVRQFRRTSTLHSFHPGPGRLVRVGLFARIFDALFSLSLLMRGRAPGGLAAGSALHYQALQAAGERFTYYGRVVRTNGYVVLQYWFFYAFNDWRSSFHGVNDHEGDWELITVYAAEEEAGVAQPCWLAYSAHDSDGDDLRRRWDDPDLERIGDHPLAYAGAGSHAHYFFPGEYMPAVPLPYTEGLARLWFQVRRLWARLGQGAEPEPHSERGGFRIPFVDYARGDGRRIGVGQTHAWEMRLLQATEAAPAPPWVDGYPGLWGHYSGDPLGENAPPGPRYERDGTQRRRWYDPLGWCGLDKVPPPTLAIATLEQQQERLRTECRMLEHAIAEQTAEVEGDSLQMTALSTPTARRTRHGTLQPQLKESLANLEQAKSQLAGNELAREACARYAARLAEGDQGDPCAHLHHPPLPSSPMELRLGKLAAIWSAISVAVLLVAILYLWHFTNVLGPGIVVLLGVYAFIEALFHHRLERLIWLVSVGLAIVTVLVLIAHFFWPLMLALVVLLGLFVVVENVRELRT
jgi:hypothetical protein